MRVRNGLLIPSTRAEAIADVLAGRAGYVEFRLDLWKSQQGVIPDTIAKRLSQFLDPAIDIVSFIPARGYEIKRKKRK